MGVAEAPTGSSRSGGDYLSILSGTTQNIVGIAIAAVATFAAQILMTRTLGPAGFGTVTVMTQLVFVLSFATRAGMDMAVLRNVAIDVGAGHTDRLRAMVSRAALTALVVSSLVAVLMVLVAPAVRDAFSLDDPGDEWVVHAAAVGLPFLALANVWLAATRGLKIMRYTLYVFWAGQPIIWIVLMVAGWRIDETPAIAILAYGASWAWATVMAAYYWRREARPWRSDPLEPGAFGTLLRYAGPRAPAALFSQLLFWTDLFVVTRYVSDEEVGVYSAALRAGQIVVLFLTSVNLMFAPYVAELHSKGEIQRLDKLFKTLTRWTIAATLPIFIVVAVAPDLVLEIFGDAYSEGETALLIILAGQFVNICSGSVGFVLIMVGRTGWDLLVYAGSLALDLGLAFWLAPKYGIEGAAVANAVTFSVSNLARLLLVKRAVGIQPYDRDYLRLLLPVAAGTFAAWGAHRLVGGAWPVDLIATAGAGTLAYVASYLAFGVTQSERAGLSGLLAKVRAR